MKAVAVSGLKLIHETLHFLMIADASIVGSFRIDARERVMRNEHQLPIDDKEIGMARIAANDGVRPSRIDQAAVGLSRDDFRVVVEEIELRNLRHGDGSMLMSE